MAAGNDDDGGVAGGVIMLTHWRTRLKVCCISSRDEARIAIAAGADALGLVAQMPSGPGRSQMT